MLSMKDKPMSPRNVTGYNSSNRGGSFGLMLEDFKMKELESISIDKMKMDRDKLERDYRHLIDELEILKEDLKSTQRRCKERENELRAHIGALSGKIRIRDKDAIRESMQKLQCDIVKSIHAIENQSRDEIISKKREVEARLHMRLVDTDYRYNNVLKNKVSEQKEILRTLHEYTLEMEKIKDNYLHVKDKANSLLRENEQYKIFINELELKNSKLKSDLKKIKHLNNQIVYKLYSHHHTKEAAGQITNSDDLIKYPKSTSEQLHKCAQQQITQSPINNPKEINLNMVLGLINDEEFLVNNFRSCNVMSSLANIYDNTKIRTAKIKKEIEEKCQVNLITECLYAIIQKFKMNYLNQSLNNSQSSRNLINEINVNSGLSLNKEHRKLLMELIVKDLEIKNFVYDEKFPNVANADRKLV